MHEYAKDSTLFVSIGSCGEGACVVQLPYPLIRNTITLTIQTTMIVMNSFASHRRCSSISSNENNRLGNKQANLTYGLHESILQVYTSTKALMRIDLPIKEQIKIMNKTFRNCFDTVIFVYFFNVQYGPASSPPRRGLPAPPPPQRNIISM